MHINTKVYSPLSTFLEARGDGYGEDNWDDQDRVREAWMMLASAFHWLTRTTQHLPLSFCLYGQSPEPIVSGLQAAKAHTTHVHTHLPVCI